MEISRKEKHQIQWWDTVGQTGGGISTLRKQAFDDDDIFDVSVWNFYPNYDDWDKDSENLFSSLSANDVTVMLPYPSTLLGIFV